ncbi:MAG: PQQ-dependent sugar dehydrogenase [Limisphaerales bacterium]
MNRPFLAAVLTLVALLAAPLAEAQLRIMESAKIGGFGMATSARSFGEVTVHEVIDATRRVGVALIELQFGQPIVAGRDDLVLNESLDNDGAYDLKRRLQTAGITPVAARVSFGNNTVGNTRIFEAAQILGIQVLVTEPAFDRIEEIERLARKFTIRVGILTSAKDPTGSRPEYWNPEYLAKLLDRRSIMLGVVLDVRNLLKAGIEPGVALDRLKSRVFGVRVTGLQRPDGTGVQLPFGEGQFDSRGFLKLLDDEAFTGFVVLSFDPGRDDPAADIEKSLEFVRREGVLIRRDTALRLASASVRTAPGFRYEALVQGEMPEPMRVRVSPDGQVWMAGRRGDFWLYDPETRTNRVAGFLNVQSQAQRGLRGFEFDPGFATNGHLYVFYAPMISTGNSNRLSRFTVTGARGERRLDPQTESVLFQIPGGVSGDNEGGSLLYHPAERCFYIGTGDGNLTSNTLRFFDDPNTYAQNLLDPRGKVLRIAPDGSAPKDNPFAGRTNAHPAVYALGFRNPYTLTLDPVSGRVYAADIGFERRQDVEEINLLQPAGNYGWPRCVSTNRDTATFGDCPIPEAISPWFFYPHESSAAVMVGPVIQPAAARTNYPPAFARGMVYGDFSRRWLRFAQMDEGGAVTNTVSLATGLAGGPLSMTLGPAGEIYLVEYSGWLGGSPRDRLSRLVPVPVAPATNAAVAAAPRR